ncbi:ATP-binding protein [Gryllotalpicola reticulitermitis]|uniref:histidine kinase n=1 Tax=Gryllotalpicola reticulitermitis TaxID=1184153 RepID=A0ABV8Q874_9MICO
MNGGLAIPRVQIVAPTPEAAAAARSAVAAAGIGDEVAGVVSEVDGSIDEPVLIVADTLSEIDESALVDIVDYDFVLTTDVPAQLTDRLGLLHRRCERRMERLAEVEELRRRTMELTWNLHAERDIPALARAVLAGLHQVFACASAAVVIPAEAHFSDGAYAAAAWISRAGEPPRPAPKLGRIVGRAFEKLRQSAGSPIAIDGGDVLDLTRAEAPELLTQAFGSRAQRLVAVPIRLDSEVLGELMIVDTDAPAQRSALEKSMLSRVALQVGRAVSEVRARYRQQQTNNQLYEASAELQRLVDERDDLGVVIRSIADAINVGVLFYDNENHPQLHNRMVEKMLGLTGFDPATGRSTHVYASDRRTRVKQDKNIVSETLEGDSRGLIYWIGDPQAGEQRAVVTEAHVITRPDGERLGAAVVTYDVTDLANAIEIREEYLATVSHELRTPLTSIVGYLDLIDDAHDVEALGFGKEFRTIQHSAEQMLALIRDLLSTSTRELTLRIEPTDVGAVVTQSVSTLRPTVAAAHQRLVLDLPEGTVLAHVDGPRVKQVVDNLISNAVKYTPDGGTITVTLARDDESITISVADTGRGIKKTDQSRLFDRFFRAREAREAAIQGVGIGLTIVKTIVDGHGGEVTVTSEPGHGSTFTVQLPVRVGTTPLATLAMQP